MLVASNFQEAGDKVRIIKGIKRTMRRRVRLMLTVSAAILGVLLITGCGPGTSGASGAQQLIQEYPWLAQLGVPFIVSLLQQYGPDLAGLLLAALAAL